MQQRFLALAQSLSQAPKQLCGLWLVHSDEPLVLQWLIDACRPSWQAHSQFIKRIELNSPKQWQEAINELSALSLFAESSAIIVTGKHKPDHDTMDALARFADDVKAGNSSHHLIWLLPKQDKKSQATKAFRLFDTHGTIIDGNIYNEKQRQELLHYWATRLNMTLDTDAWRILMSHTEHDLLTAYQTLWRLSFNHTAPTQSTPTNIDGDTLMTLLTEGGSFSVFDLSDALIAQNAIQSLKILHHLKQTDTAPSIILWAINKDLQTIAGLQAGKDAQSLGIWRNKENSYYRLSNRLSPQSINHAISDVYEIDKSIKGLSDANVWRQLERLILGICGVDVLQVSV